MHTTALISIDLHPVHRICKPGLICIHTALICISRPPTLAYPAPPTPGRPVLTSRGLRVRLLGVTGSRGRRPGRRRLRVWGGRGGERRTEFQYPAPRSTERTESQYPGAAPTPMMPRGRAHRVRPGRRSGPGRRRPRLLGDRKWGAGQEVGELDSCQSRDRK